MGRPKDLKPGTSSPETPTQAAGVASSAVKGASLLILLQVISRIVTFIANQALLRLLTAPLLGLSSQLEVYYLSILFFARESLRVSVQRQGLHTQDTSDRLRSQDEKRATRQASQAAVNLAHLAIVIGLFVSAALGWIYLLSSPDQVLQMPYLPQSVYLYGIAAMMELLSEPCFVLLQMRLQFETRAVAESAATFSRCIALLGTAFLASRHGLTLGVLPFALGQLAYGVMLLLVYWTSVHGLATSAGFSLLPRPIAGSEQFLMSYLYKPTVKLARGMMIQSLVKHLLTQGDTFLISFFSTPEVQGTYALANNYGGLLARVLFQPVEESSRTYFSRLLADTSVPSGEKPSTSRQATRAIQEAKESLQTLARLYMILSTLIVSLGPSLAVPLLAIVAGSRWTSIGAGDVLIMYCFYIPFLALNGLTESFVASVASETELHKQSVWMSVFSVTFALAAFVFMRLFSLGAQGLVLANIVNMACRITWSLVFMKSFFRRQGTALSITSIVPGSTVMLSLSASATLHRFVMLDDAAKDPFSTIARISAFAVPFLLIVYVHRDSFKIPFAADTSKPVAEPIDSTFLERRFFLQCIRSVRTRKAAKHQ